MAEDPCVVVYRTLAEFADIRGYKLIEKTRLDKYDFQVKLNQDGYYPVHMVNSSMKCIVAAILSEHSKYYKKGADFESLIKTLERSVDKSLNIEEVIIITTADIAEKKTIIKIVNRFSTATSKNTVTKDNYKPLAKYYNLYKYSIFYMNILRHVSVGSNYYVLPPNEKKEIIEYHRKKKSDFPKILSSSSIVPWIGARPGDIIRVTLFSVSACHEIKYLALV
jgi:DNA-directed RNA polymerase subunit H (RpoH/RPB5)